MGNKTTITRNTIVTQTEELVSTDLDAETVLLSIGSGKYYGMDEIGSRVWALIAEPRPVSELCDILLREYDVEREQCEHDVLVYLNGLAEEKLVKVVMP